MRVVSVDTLQPGQEIGRSLVDARGQVLLHKGVCLTEEYIQTLRDKGYTRLFIQESDEPDIEIEEDLSPAVRAQAMARLRKSYDDIAAELSALRSASFEDALKAAGSEGVRVLMSTRGPIDAIIKLVSRILEDVLTRPTLAGLTSLKSADSRLYDHSLDVCVVAIMIGKALDLPPSRMTALATGCLLHDIGMIFISQNQDETIRIKQHTQLGYELLRNSDNPDILSPHVAYEHHEHQDGSGLPRGLVGSNRLQRERGVSTPIPTLIGEIAAVANAYDNMISGVHGTDPVSPDLALSFLTEHAGARYNRDVVAGFRRVAPVYPKGTQVLLRGAPFDGFVGVVSKVTPDKLQRPWVLLVRDGARAKIEPQLVDTSEHPDIILQSIGL